MVKHPWPLLEISLSDFRGLAMLGVNAYLPITPALLEMVGKARTMEKASLCCSLLITFIDHP